MWNILGIPTVVMPMAVIVAAAPTEDIAPSLELVYQGTF